MDRRGRALFLTKKSESDPDVTLGDEVKAEGVLGENRSIATQEIKMPGAD